MLHNLKRLLVRTNSFTMVLLTFIELLTNHGSGTEVQDMETAANITKKAITNLQTQNSFSE